MARLIAMLLMAVFLCSSCGSSPAPSPAPTAPSGYTGQVMLYCSMQDDQIQAIKRGFEAKYPEIEMNYYFASSGKILTKLASEVQSGQIAADVLWMGTPAGYISLKESRVLSPYISPQAIHIDPAFSDEHFYYTGARLISLVIGYNSDMIAIHCPVGLVAGCPDERNGRLLYDYILSKEGQQILVEEHLHSIREDVEQPGVSVQTILDTRMPVDDSYLSAHEAETIRKFDRIFFH